MTPLKTRPVIKAHKRSYDDPIILAIGDRVQITNRDMWDGIHEWLWCIHANSKEGWVPSKYLRLEQDTGYATRAYNALELTVTVGDDITIREEQAGWYWCETIDGRAGWLPVTCFAQEAPPTA